MLESGDSCIPKQQLVHQSVISERTKHWLLWMIVLLGFGLRLYMAWLYNSYQPDSPERLIGDEPGYDNMARELLQGYGFTWPGRVPLYPLWLMGIYWLTNGSYSFVPYIQALLGVAAIFLTYLLARKTLGYAAGFMAALFTATSYILIHQSLHLLSEVLFTPVVLLVTLALYDAIHKPSMNRFLWAGFWTGVSTLVRPTLLFFPLAVIILLLIMLRDRRILRYWTAYVLTMALVITPWVLHNYIRYQAVFALQTSNAILWQGSPEYYHLIHDQGYTYMKIWSEILYGPGWEAHDPNSVEGDRYWTKRASSVDCQ